MYQNKKLEQQFTTVNLFIRVIPKKVFKNQTHICNKKLRYPQQISYLSFGLEIFKYIYHTEIFRKQYKI